MSFKFSEERKTEIQTEFQHSKLQVYKEKGENLEFHTHTQRALFSDTEIGP